MASTALAEISRLDLVKLKVPPLASIDGVKQLSSYNWIEAPTPTIAVPGSPPLWSAPKVPRRLKKDTGLIYIAQNAARHPESPLEPLFRALYVADPSFDIRLIDVVSDRNNIRKLLSFVNPASSRNGLEAFTIGVEVVKSTAIFCREETLTHEFIGPHEFRGFGHEFEKAYTKGQISGSTGHHRIITYRFSDLNFIVRHETDGYVNADKMMSPSTSEKMESDSLSSLLGSLSLSSNNNTTNVPPAGSKLTIKEEGNAVPLDSNLEIKTRVSHKLLELQEIAPQLWVSQTLKLVRAYHQKGIFQEPKVEDVAAQIKAWEERNQTDLRKLAALIKHIIKVAKEGGGNAVVKYDDKTGKLVVRKVDKRKMLPKDLYAKWDDTVSAEAKSTTEHDAGAKKTQKPIDKDNIRAEEKSAAADPIGTKAMEATGSAKEVQQTVPDDLPANPTPAKGGNHVSQAKGDGHPAVDRA